MKIINFPDSGGFYGLARTVHEFCTNARISGHKFEYSWPIRGWFATQSQINQNQKLSQTQRPEGMSFGTLLSVIASVRYDGG